MTYATEFSDFPAADMPQIPAGFDDVSWGNEPCPSFIHAKLQLVLFVDFLDVARREYDDLARFSLSRQAMDAEGAYLADSEREELIASDNWSEVLAVILGEAFAAKCVEAFEPAELADIRRRNATPEYAGDVCATHDFCDANELMAEAFEAVVGRPLALGDDEPDQQADCALWGKAWGWAKSRHLTAASVRPSLLASAEQIAEIRAEITAAHAIEVEEAPASDLIGWADEALAFLAAATPDAVVPLPSWAVQRMIASATEDWADDVIVTKA